MSIEPLPYEASRRLLDSCSEPCAPLDMTSPGEIRREREGLHPYYREKARSRAETLSCCLVVLGALLVGTLVAWVGWWLAGVWR